MRTGTTNLHTPGPVTTMTGGNTHYQRKTGGNSTSTKQQDDDAFMTLPDQEIANCLCDIGITFTVADLLKPNPSQIQKVFEWFAELLMSVTRDVVSPAMRAAVEDIVGRSSISHPPTGFANPTHHATDNVITCTQSSADVDRLFPPDTRDMIGLFVELRKLLLECQITDFALSDILRPTHPRLVKILSYIINFIRFRESQTSVIDAHFNKTERTKLRIEQLLSENATAERRLAQLEEQREAQESAIREREAKANDLKQRLLDLKKEQENVCTQVDEGRIAQAQAKANLEAQTAAEINARRIVSRLKPYASQEPPATLELQLREMNDKLALARQQLENTERRARAFINSAEAFSVATIDVKALNKLATDISAELQRETEESASAARVRDALVEQNTRLRDVEHRERRLRQLFNNARARCDTLRETTDNRAAKAAERLHELREEHRELASERSERLAVLERRKAKIDQIYKKMADLKNSIENEVNDARDQYMKLNAHIRLYIVEMEQCLV